VQLDDLAGDGQAQPQSPFSTRGLAPGLSKLLEHVGQEGGRDAGSGVLHRYLHLPVHRLDAHAHRAAFGGELDGVGEEVPQHLLQPAGVSGHGTRFRIHVRGQRDALRLRRGADGLEGGPDHGHRLHGLHLDLHGPGHDPGDVQEVRDEAHLRAGIPQDRVEGAHGRRLVDLLFAEDVSPSQHGAQRSAELVGDGGEEGVLEAPVLAQALRLLPELVRGASQVGELGLEPSAIVRAVPHDGGAAGQRLGEVRQAGAHREEDRQQEPLRGRAG